MVVDTGQVASARVARRRKHFTAKIAEERKRQVSEKVDGVVQRADGRRGGRVGGWERERGRGRGRGSSPCPAGWLRISQIHH